MILLQIFLMQYSGCGCEQDETVVKSTHIWLGRIIHIINAGRHPQILLISIPCVFL